MAGEWIKMRTNLWDDPRVSQICDETGVSEAAVVGALYWLWASADEHTEDGLMHGLSVGAINRKTGVKGMGESLVSVGWIAVVDGGIEIKRFSEHNGESAKSRAQTAKRVAKHKGNAKVTVTALPENESSVTTALPREEKIREEKQTTTKSKAIAPATPKRPKSSKVPLPDGFCVSEQVREWAQKKNVQHLDRHFSSFIDKAKANGYVYADWDAALRNAISDDWAKLGLQPPPRGSPPAQQSRHTGFEKKDYGEGIGSDGRIN